VLGDQCGGLALHFPDQAHHILCPAWAAGLKQHNEPGMLAEFRLPIIGGVEVIGRNLAADGFQAFGAPIDFDEEQPLALRIAAFQNDEGVGIKDDLLPGGWIIDLVIEAIPVEAGQSGLPLLLQEVRHKLSQQWATWLGQRQLQVHAKL